MSSRFQALRNRLPHPVQAIKILFRGIFFSALLVTLFHLKPASTALQQVQQRGTLILAGTSGPTTFQETVDGSRGFQYELAQLFADELGVELVLDDTPDTSGVLNAIRRNKADIAITGLATDDPRLKRLRVAEPYMAVSEQLIQRLDKPIPARFDDVESARIGVVAGSTEAVRLKAMTQWRPDITLIEFNDTDPLLLLDQVTSGELDYVAMNSSEFDARRALFPNLGVSLNLQDNSELAWAFVKTRDQTLFRAAQAFLARKQADGTLDRLVAFYSQGDTFDPYSVRSFQRDITQKLPRYEAMFRKNADAQDMDWRLLAAIAYQESRWQPNATSPTGVRGMMMLTRDTASYMGVADRTNARQSIEGGAGYYRQILERLPDTVREPDRTWMALAAYNMGPAHIDRARRNAEESGDDADKWLTVSRHLRLMAANARKQGRRIPVGQALVYVQQVRRYYDTLQLASSFSSDMRVAMNQSERDITR
jgi:membrane-bound lytic murein transglycosylase F